MTGTLLLVPRKVNMLQEIGRVDRDWRRQQWQTGIAARAPPFSSNCLIFQVTSELYKR